MYDEIIFCVHCKHKFETFETHSPVFRMMWNAVIQFFLHWSFIVRVNGFGNPTFIHINCFNRANKWKNEQTRKKLRIIIYLRPLPCMLHATVIFVLYILFYVWCYCFRLEFVLWTFPIQFSCFICIFIELANICSFVSEKKNRNCYPNEWFSLHMRFGCEWSNDTYCDIKYLIWYRQFFGASAIFQRFLVYWWLLAPKWIHTYLHLGLLTFIHTQICVEITI